MSDYLGFIPDGELPANTLIVNVHDHFRDRLTGFGWQVVGENKTNDQSTLLYLAPPASETIGTAWIREVVQLNFRGTSISVVPITEALQAFPQILAVSALSGGLTSNSLSLGGVTVAQDPGTLNAAHTAAENLEYLYDAIRASTNPAFTGWDWTFIGQTPQNDAQASSIIGVRKTASANLAPTVTGCTAEVVGDYHAAGFQVEAETAFQPATALSVDLINGFGYLLTVMKRSFHLATKTITATSGPVHVCWGERARAEAVVPSVPAMFAKFVSPIELVVGADDAATELTSKAKTAKCWSTRIMNLSRNTPNLTTGGERIYSLHPFVRGSVHGVWMDGFLASNDVTNGWEITLPGEGLFSANASTVGNDYQIHRVGMGGHAVIDGRNEFRYTSTIYPYATAVIGALDLRDWFKFVGTCVDGVRILSGDPLTPVVLNQAMDGATDYPTLQVVSTSALQSVGTVIFGREAITYTGKTATTLTGCARGANGSKRMPHHSGDEGRQGLWFVKVNGGAMFAGYTKP